MELKLQQQLGETQFFVTITEHCKSPILMLWWWKSIHSMLDSANMSLMVSPQTPPAPSAYFAPFSLWDLIFYPMIVVAFLGNILVIIIFTSRKHLAFIITSYLYKKCQHKIYNRKRCIQIKDITPLKVWKKLNISAIRGMFIKTEVSMEIWDGGLSDTIKDVIKV